MKLQCSCGAKYSFEVTPGLAQKPAHFVCPACGLDVSGYLNELVRQELGASGPVAASETPAAGSSAPPLRVRVHMPVPAAAAAQESSDAEGRPCPKHPAEWATEKCYVCSKPICPKCMEIFGYVCSPFCRAKANSHGIEVPIYEGQQSVVEARQLRATVWAATAVAALVAVALGFWVWYKWFGSTPKEIFSVRLPGPVYSGQSQICGGNQIVFLHGGMLARYDMPQKKQIWTRELVDPNVVAYEVAREMKANQEMVDRANNQGWEHVPKIPSKETLLKRVSRSMAAELELRVRGSN